jgi:hypothetical protein
MDFGDEEDDVTLEMIEDFEQMVGKHQAVIASSSYWGEQTFPTANLNVVWRHGSLPLLFWSPWDKPYTQNRGPDKFNLTDIIAGKWDAYIDKWADSARDFGHPMIVAFGVEMNGDWFPWSGTFYGGEDWDESVPAGRRTSNGCFTPTIIPTRSTLGILRRPIIRVPITSIGWA